MKKLTGLALSGLMIIAAAAVLVAPALSGDGPLPAELQEVRSAVARYHSFAQAERDGYTVEGEPCVVLPGGTMSATGRERLRTTSVCLPSTASTSCASSSPRTGSSRCRRT